MGKTKTDSDAAARPARVKLIDAVAALKKGADAEVVREWAGETTAYVTASMLRKGRYNGGRVPAGEYEYRAEVLKDKGGKVTGSRLWARRTK